ncbi:putative 60S acidic ribosomal protein P2-1 [Monocercomonoides exilis]|uniref:putative 60S acidic ribosomal protein P2-1 n=1 Tax=Monocercomonoides exilis TaxID=2049356 RepID=UPI00355A37CE|nr:putative 60S acidic ribosomal protein P2-1 [Monocercomonoides exilis]|eukprot:MONOS_13412.1-p1 / transcript=MONOS_13412.1 / gene=MONOS_13412 / organism=Monocercomonoides_exilis_PA203 / gene_product=60S acidic ribosomal protein P2-1 / transcript_product=60S acidic ribosomal protein P2-1 / location=Mono_scaffold00824:9082-9514(+) / protein_length=117 / sequence_SO=supercontig / SO=protein_coding / is_pseudo=false
MKYTAAFLLSQLGGKTHPKKADLVKILKAAGADVDEGKADDLISKVGTRSGEEVLEEGQKKMAEASLAAAAAASTVAAPSASAAPEKETKKEEAKKEEKKEEEEEEFEGGMFDLFG